MSHSKKKAAISAVQHTPTLGEEEKFAKVVQLRGANICEVEFPNGERTLSQIPQRFRKLIWIKTGNFVIVREPKDMPQVKIRSMVEHVLFPDHIKSFKDEGKWPVEFNEVNIPDVKVKGKKDPKDDPDSDDDLFVNPNHRVIEDSDDDESSSEEESDEDD